MTQDGILSELDLSTPWHDYSLRNDVLPAACRKLAVLETELEDRPELREQVEAYREAIAQATSALPIHRGEVVYLAQGYFPDGSSRPRRRAVFQRFPRPGGNSNIARLRYLDSGEVVCVPMHSWWRLPTAA